MSNRSTSILAGLALATVAATAPAAGAQDGPLNPQCQAPAYVPGTLPSVAQLRSDACQKAHDLFAFMFPQLGVSITGGNPVLGSGGTLGGLGHFVIGLRANALQGQLPQADNVQLSATGAQRSDFAPKSQILGLPAVEGAIGIFKGIPLGITNVGGVDLLVSAFYVPNLEQDEFSVKTDGGSVRFGYGARVGLLQETAVIPGVSVSYLRRDLPTVDLVARVGTRDSVRVTGLETRTSAWRVVAAKRFLFLGLAAGAGQDTYDAEARASAFIGSRPIAGGILQSPAFNADVATPEQKLTRTNVFADVSLNFPVVRIVGEIGRVAGGDLPATYNRFGDRAADAAYTYGSVGFRIGF